MVSKLENNDNGMDLWTSKRIISEYMNNGREITPEVKEAYLFCHGLGMKSYPFMKCLLGEDLAKEIVSLDGKICQYLKNEKS